MDLDAALKGVAVQARRHAQQAGEEARKARQQAEAYNGDTPAMRDARWTATAKAEKAEALEERWSVRAQAAAEGKIAMTQYDDSDWCRMTFNLRPIAHAQKKVFVYVEGQD